MKLPNHQMYIFAKSSSRKKVRKDFELKSLDVQFHDDFGFMNLFWVLHGYTSIFDLILNPRC